MSAHDNQRSEAWRTEIDFTNSVTQAVSALFNDRNSMLALGGAVFALQQDMKKAANINLWGRTNIVRDLIEQQMAMPQARPLADEVVSEALKDLSGIQDTNLKFLESYRTTYKANPPAHLTPQELEGHVLQAGLRCRASEVWALTISFPSATGAQMVQLAATNVWMRFGMMRVHEAAEWAKLFSGTYYNGVKCQDFEVTDWPAIR